MKVKELVRRLKLCDQNKPIRFYFLQYANLNGCEYETLLEFDEQAELTIKLDDSDENGNEQASEQKG